MVQGPRRRVPFRRRREARTDYRHRLRLLQGGQPRAVVRKTLNGVIVQLVAYDPGGDRILATAVTRELAKHGWTGHGGNLPAAYLTGLLAGKRAVAAGVAGAVLDVGRHPARPGSRVFAVLQGLLDAGMTVPHGDVLPDPDRLLGRHISEEVAARTLHVKERLEAM